MENIRIFPDGTATIFWSFCGWKRKILCSRPRLVEEDWYLLFFKLFIAYRLFLLQEQNPESDFTEVRLYLENFEVLVGFHERQIFFRYFVLRIRSRKRSGSAVMWLCYHVFLFWSTSSNLYRNEFSTNSVVRRGSMRVYLTYPIVALKNSIGFIILYHLHRFFWELKEEVGLKACSTTTS